MAGKENFFKTSDGVWIYFETSGEGKPVVLIPGFGASVALWRHSVPVLSKHYQVVNLDPRGHGRSMKVPGTNNQERMAQDIRELIDYLGLQDVLMIGHSLGGALAASYARLHHEHCLRGLILADATLYAFSDESWNHHRGRNYNIDGWYQRMMPYITDPAGYAAKQRAASPLQPEDADLMQESMLQIPPWVGAEYHLDTYFTDNMTPLKDRTIPVATFVSHSSYHDAWESGHEAVRRMVKSPLAVCYEFTACNNHMFPILEADKFNACVLDFDQKIEALR